MIHGQMEVGDGTVLCVEAAMIIPLNPATQSRERAIVWAIVNTIPSLDRDALVAMAYESDEFRRSGTTSPYPATYNRALHALLEAHDEFALAERSAPHG